jgi:hypothetical protein
MTTKVEMTSPSLIENEAKSNEGSVEDIPFGGSGMDMTARTNERVKIAAAPVRKSATEGITSGRKFAQSIIDESAMEEAKSSSSSEEFDFNATRPAAESKPKQRSSHQNVPLPLGRTYAKSTFLVLEENKTAEFQVIPE